LVNRRDDSGGTAAPAAPPQSPVFRATNADRYQRQEALREIEDATGRRLICYTAAPEAMLDRADVTCFADLVHDLDEDADVDLMITTHGGDVDAALRIVHLLRKAVPRGTLRAVIPNTAKSAGTLVAIGTDRLVMSDTSELGPIDPLLIVPGPAGTAVRRPAKSYVAAFSEAVDRAADAADPDRAAVWQRLVESFDPAMLVMCRQALDRTRDSAEQLLRDGMLRPGAARDGTATWTQVAANLMSSERLKTHGAVITCDEASRMGLEVEYLPRQDPLWQAYWRLHCLQVVRLETSDRLFEGRRVSLHVSR
jgi:hypothetical protein